MPRLVRLHRRGDDADTVSGYAIDPADFTKHGPEEGVTYEEAGYTLHSYEDTGEPYKMPPAVKERVEAAKAERAAEPEAPKAEKKG